MYRYKEKKGKKKERSRNFSQFSCLRNARTFKLLSLRVRCIRTGLFSAKDYLNGVEMGVRKPKSTPFLFFLRQEGFKINCVMILD